MVSEVVVNQLGGIIFFLIALLIGIAFVSIHYRKKYETIKEEYGLIDTEEIREARIKLRSIHQKQSTELSEIVNKIDKGLEILEDN